MTFPPPSSGAAGFPAPVFSHSYPYIIFVPSHWKYFSIIFLFCNAFLAEQTQRFPWDISMNNKYSHETQIYSWNMSMKHKYFHENTNISMRHFHETKNLSVKCNIICFGAKIPNRENPLCEFNHTLLWRGYWSTALSTFICQPLQSRCSYKLPISSRPLLAGLVLFQSFANDKDEIFFTSAMKIHISLSARLVKHLQHQPNQSKSNLSRQAPLSQQEADEKVISQQANQTLWLFHNRQDQTLWLFFVAVPLVIPQCIQSQSCTEDGNENPVLHTIPQQPQTSTLSSGSVA